MPTLRPTPPPVAFKLLSLLGMPAMQQLGRFIAWVIGNIKNASPNKVTRRNIQLVFPNLSATEQEQLIKQSLQHQAMSLMEFVKIWGSSDTYALNQIKHVTGENILRQALSNPNGCLAIVPHFASWEVMNAWVNQLAQPVMMYKPFRNKQIDSFVRSARSRSHATLVTADESGVRQVFKTLKQGGFSIILPDHIPQASGGIDVPFMGINVLTSTLVAKLASKTGCSVVQLACMRVEDGFQVLVQQVSDTIYSKDLSISTSTLNQSIEALIRQYPSHYHWNYKRFKPATKLHDYYYVDDEQAAQIRKEM